MTDTGSYRRFGRAFSGTRPHLRLGDPGIDRHWLTRRRWGMAVATIWFTLLPLTLSIGFMSRWGVFGQVDTWQLDTFGSNNVILLVLLFTPLMFVPHVITQIAKIDGSKPFLLGMRQAFDNDWGPRFVRERDDPSARFRILQRICVGVAVVGALAVGFGIWKGNHDAAAPHAPLPRVSFAKIIDPGLPLPDAVQLTGVVADRSSQWSYDYAVRQDSHHDVYYPLRPAGQPATVPVSLVELDQTSPQYDAKPWNMVDAPGPREGRPAVLGDWEAKQLRRNGLRLAPRVIVLTREQLHGKSPFPDPMDDMIYGLLGAVALFLGGVLGFAFHRQRHLRAGVA